MPVETQHRFSVEEYHRMGETGILAPAARVELLDGKIIDMPPIGSFHSGSVNWLNRLFNDLAKGRWLVTVQNPVQLTDYSEPIPDLLLLKPASHFYKKGHPRPEEVLLLIEVADASLEFDRSEKLPAYGRSGIAEVWIVNLPGRTIEVYREPHFTGYNTKQILCPGQRASPVAFPDVAIDVAQLLER